MTEERVVLSVNVGSSSIKCVASRVTGEQIQTVASAAPGNIDELDNALQQLEADLDSTSFDVIGHRIVHGGSAYTHPVVITGDVLEKLHELEPFAPLHLPPALEAIAVASKRFDDIPQVACFDTAFHRTMPEVAQRLPLPNSAWNEGVRRYGFHGLSYEHVVHAIGADVLGRSVVAHLGAGSSLCAIRDGVSIDTTMGFSPTGGLMMATRSGDLDPGVLIYLLRSRGYDVESLAALLNHESGLLGVSGTTGDMRSLLEQCKSGDTNAILAVAMFTRSVQKHIGELIAVLGGIDTLVFTGGIGENAAFIRAEICRGLEMFGISLDETRNAHNDAVVSLPDRAVTVRIVPTDEAQIIARHAASLL